MAVVNRLETPCLTDKCIDSLVQERANTFSEQENNNPFYLCDLGDIFIKYKTWRDTFPRIAPFYAVKCNDDQRVLQIMAELGMSFDCASIIEIQRILSLGVSPESIVFAHPCKQAEAISYATSCHVTLMTFDNELELFKIQRICPNARLLLRILPPRGRVQFDLGKKFGCPLSEVEKMFTTAKDLGLSIVGVSFHVGNGCQEASLFSTAIQLARGVFDKGKTMGFQMVILDIGGGFPGRKSLSGLFNKICDEVNTALDVYFPSGEGVKIIAEPGTYFVESAFTLCTNIIAKRVLAEDDNTISADMSTTTCNGTPEVTMEYYINDGVYGSFLNYHIGKFDPDIKIFNKDLTADLYPSTIWGPTCDSVDLVMDSVQLPDLSVSDWVYFRNMGAYTCVLSTSFNGMPRPSMWYFCGVEIWKKIQADHE